MRRCALGAASMLAVSSALLLPCSPASGASGFHCPGPPALQTTFRLRDKGYGSAFPVASADAFSPNGR